MGASWFVVVAQPRPFACPNDCCAVGVHATEVCGALKRISELGLTIVAVIHQPRYEIFMAFDDVLFLGKGGRTVYLGASFSLSSAVLRSGRDAWSSSGVVSSVDTVGFVVNW